MNLLTFFFQKRLSYYTDIYIQCCALEFAVRFHKQFKCDVRIRISAIKSNYLLTFQLGCKYKLVFSVNLLQIALGMLDLVEEK